MIKSAIKTITTSTTSAAQKSNSTITASNTETKRKRQTSKTSQSSDRSSLKQTTETTILTPTKTTELEIICDRILLCDYLDFVSKGIPQNPTHPILGNVLFTADADKGTLQLTTNNLEFGMSVMMRAKTIVPGSMTLPLSAFGQIAKKFPNGELALICHKTSPKETKEDSEHNEPTFTIILSTPNDSSKQFEFAAHNADSFPHLDRPTTKLMTIPANILIAQLSSSLFAASSDETKKIINASHFIVSHDRERKLNILETWTTDGSKLVVTKSAIASKSQLTKPISFTLPSRALKELERNLDRSERVNIYFEQSATSDTNSGIAMFTWGNKKIVTRTIEGQFPDCASIINGNRDRYCRSFTIERMALLKTLERFTVLTDKSTKIVRLKLDSKQQTAYLCIERSDIGKGAEVHNIQMTGENIELLFNVRYLLEVVKAISADEMRFQLDTPHTPVLITPYGNSPNNSFALETEYLLAPLASMPS
jgi:DNA polymerase III subunit beta